MIRVGLAVLGTVTALSASAAGPTMSTAPGSSAACGAPISACVAGADVFAPPVVTQAVVVPLGSSLGLLPGDRISSMTLGIDKPLLPGARIRFSVGPGSAGLPATAPSVATEAAAGEAAADIFDAGTVSAPTGIGALLADGDGTIGAPAGAYPATGLSEPQDDLAALMATDVTRPVHAMGGSVYFTLAAGSPTLTALAASPAHILVAALGSGGPPVLLASPGSLGLTAADAINSLAYDVSTFTWVYTLAPGSPTLGSFGSADLLRNPGATLFLPAAALGLAPGDVVDALDISPDGDGDLIHDSFDNCAGVANNDQTDSDADGFGDFCDDGDFDGVADAFDNCPILPNPTQLDGDSDGFGDGCDLCTNLAGARTLFRGSVSLLHVNADTVPGNDRLILKGLFVNGAPFATFDPLSNPVRIVLTNRSAGMEVDAEIDAGAYGGRGSAGWQQSRNGKIWLYRDTTATPVSGITTIRLTDRSAQQPNRVRIAVGGRRATYPVVAADAPIQATIVLGGQADADAGLCTETDHNAADCSFRRSGKTLVCRRP